MQGGWIISPRCMGWATNSIPIWGPDETYDQIHLMVFCRYAGGITHRRGYRVQRDPVEDKPGGGGPASAAQRSYRRTDPYRQGLYRASHAKTGNCGCDTRGLDAQKQPFLLHPGSGLESRISNQ